MLMGRGCSCTNNIPRMSGSERTNINPCAWRWGVSASHTWKTSFDFFPSVISSLSDGNALSSSMGPVWARTGMSEPKTNIPQIASETSRRVLFRIDRMTVIVAEFHAACKIKAGEYQAFPLRQARGGSEAEAARDDAVNGPVCGQRFHALLRQR